MLTAGGPHLVQGLFQQTHHHHLTPTPGASVCAADVDSAASEEVEAIAQQAVDLILPLASTAASAAPAPAGRSDGNVVSADSTSGSGSSGGSSQRSADQPVLQMELDGQAVIAMRQRGSTDGSSGGGGSSSTGSNNGTSGLNAP